MASTLPTEIELLRELVAIPSISGNEAPCAEFLQARASALGLEVELDDTAVWISVGNQSRGPTLALTSHLDVVPPGEGWSRDPFTPVIANGLLYGRGSGDAKGSVAAMFSAMADLNLVSTQLRGRVLAIFSFGEETRNATMPDAVIRAGRLDAAIVGEPTNLQPAIAQRGLMMVDLITRGDQQHAGYADTEGFTNAITLLARELLALEGIVAERVHPLLGGTTVTPTMVEAGISRNITPPQARAVLDIRSTPAWTHEELEGRLREQLHCEVEVTSRRLIPCETPADSRLLEAIRTTLPQAHPYGSPTCSDWCYLQHLDTVKLGPGTSRRSHTPDEAIDLVEVTAARHAYAAIARSYLA